MRICVSGSVPKCNESALEMHVPPMPHLLRHDLREDILEDNHSLANVLKQSPRGFRVVQQFGILPIVSSPDVCVRVMYSISTLRSGSAESILVVSAWPLTLLMKPLLWITVDTCQR